MYKLSIISSILLSLNCFSSNQYSKLDRYLELVKEYEKGRGAVAILAKNKLVYSKHFGPENIKEPIYRIGSISKTYTAVIILRLIEEGKLNLDTKLSKFYPKIDQANLITIENLLRHTSGIPNFTDLEGYLGYHEKYQSEEMHLERFRSYKLGFSPGEKSSYSNTGYVLLSFIASKVANKSYSELLNQYITGPLKLKNTYLFDSKNPRNNEVKSYEKSAKWEVASNTHESVPLGAGAIASTAKEVVIFIRALFNEKLVTKNSLSLMTSIKAEYGLGLFNFPYNKKKFIGHTGGIDGYRSIVGYNKEDDLAFVQLTNGMATSFNDISIAILASYYKDSFDIPTFQKSISVSEDILEKYVGTYSGKNFPLKLTFHYENGALFGKASGPGQGLIPFEATSNTDFSYLRAGIKLKFSADGNSLEFTQGETFLLKKEVNN